ncbi:hypothetical protein EJB05_48137, partial [Eragrostis curvula]
MYGSCYTPFQLEHPERTKLAIGLISQEISAAGHLRRIDLYPRGCKTEDNGEYVSIFLSPVSDSEEPRRRPEGRGEGIVMK